MSNQSETIKELKHTVVMKQDYIDALHDSIRENNRQIKLLNNKLEQLKTGSAVVRPELPPYPTIEPKEDSIPRVEKIFLFAVIFLFWGVLLTLTYYFFKLDQ